MFRISKPVVLAAFLLALAGCKSDVSKMNDICQEAYIEYSAKYGLGDPETPKDLYDRSITDFCYDWGWSDDRCSKAFKDYLDYRKKEGLWAFDKK